MVWVSGGRDGGGGGGGSGVSDDGGAGGDGGGGGDGGWNSQRLGAPEGVGVQFPQIDHKQFYEEGWLVR